MLVSGNCGNEGWAYWFEGGDLVLAVGVEVLLEVVDGHSSGQRA